MSKTKKLPKAYLEAIQTIKDKGFTHIKVELEADLGRGEADGSCGGDCDDGWQDCHCDGGVIYFENDEGEEQSEECSDCNGQGYSECRECNGRGRSRDGYEVEWCGDFIERVVGSAVRQHIVYGEFYDDGSVDSEYTFTVPIEQAHLCVDVIKAFNKLNNEINGDGLPNTSNAGMHISILPSGRYPCERGLLDRGFMDNFRTEVTKLLPALYFVGTHDATTRGLQYRMPQVSDGDKYSAIYTHGDTCMEFRLFDTCYEAPEAILEKIEVIAATLKYYSREKVQVKYKEFRFPNMGDYEAPNVARWFERLSNLDALNQTLPHLKPKNKTLKKIKQDRNLHITKTDLVKKFREDAGEFRESYAYYVADLKKYNSDSIVRCMERARYLIREGVWSNRTQIESYGGADEMMAFLATSQARKYFTKHPTEIGASIVPVQTFRQWAQDHFFGDFEGGEKLLLN